MNEVLHYMGLLVNSLHSLSLKEDTRVNFSSTLFYFKQFKRF